MGPSRTVLANPSIARLEAVWAAATLGKWAFTILVALYAYGEAGAAAVGLAALVRALPSALAAPYVALLVERHSRVAALRISCAARAGFALAITVAVGAGVPLGPVLALSVGLSIADTAHKPAQAALLPAYARTPSELVAGNVIWSALDNGGFVAGSLLVGLCVATSGLTSAFAACTVAFTLAAALALTLRAAGVTPAPPDGDSPFLQGVRAIRRNPKLRVLTGVYAVDMLVQGLLDVLLVIAAIELLGLGDQGAGWLSAAWGAGGVIAATVSAVLLRRRRIVGGLLLGCVLAGLPLVALGAWPHPLAGIGLLVAFGLGCGLIEVAHLTLTQRLAPGDVLSRVYGVQEVIDVGTTAMGGIAAAGLVLAVGVDGALIVAGVLLPCVALLVHRPLAAMRPGEPVPEEPFVLLRQLPIFASLPVATVEQFAVSARPLRVDAGTDVVVRGEHGDLFYVVTAGTVEIVGHGIVRGRGEHFGEIALLRDVPRTATVRASTPASLLAIDRGEFLAGIGSHTRTLRAMQQVARERALPPAPAAR